MKFTDLFTIFILIIAPVLGVNAQNQEGTTTLLNSTVPIAPNAAALARLADVPVSYYIGTPNISVPIYNIVQGGLSLPISVNYQATGVRVDDIASWVGTGWSLNAGGMVSRSIRGLPDEKEGQGFFDVGYKINDPATSDQNYNYLYNVVSRNSIDSQPDIYFINLPGVNVRFTFDTNQNPVLQSYQQIKIERIPNADLYGSQWKITTAEGTQYFFGEQSIDGITYGGVDKSELTPEGKPPATGPSSWHLYKIVSADGFDKILFQYENEDLFSYELNLEETYSERNLSQIAARPYLISCSTIFPKTTVSGSIQITQKLISRIKYTQGTVEFSAEDGRYDIHASRLSKISIKNKEGVLIKHFDFIHSYFGTPSYRRLKLDKVIEFSSSGESLPPYEFKYDETNPLPARGSYKQDHWGYYNDNPKDSFIPKNIERGNGTFLVYDQGGNRDTDPILTKSGTLTKIIYPTGGYDIFDYEAHELGMIQGETITVYDDVVMADLSVKPDLQQQNMDVTSSFVLTESYSADIIVGGTKQGMVSVAGGSTMSSQFISLGWSPAEGNGSKTYTVTLQEGTYNCRAFGDWESATNWVRASIKVVIHVPRQVTLPSEKVYAGGVRVARISRYDNVNNLPKVTRFVYTSSSTGLSSGVLIRKPKYYFTYLSTTDVTSGSLICPYEAGYSSSKVPLGEGTHIGYSEVKVLEGENGENGYQILKFTTAAEFPDGDFNVNFFPFPPPESRDSRRGLLKEKWIYDKENNPISAIINEYTQRTDKHIAFAEGLQVGMQVPRDHEVIISPEDPSYAGFLLDFAVRVYKFRQEWQYLSKTTERTYSQLHDDTYTEKVTTFSYDRPDNHVQLTRQEVDLKDGTKLTTKYKYPQDYTTGGNLGNINALVNAFVLATPVEVQHWKTVNGETKLLSSMITDYHPDYFTPTKIWTLNTATPLTGLNNEQPDANGKYLDILSDSTSALLETRANFEYESGKLTAQNKVNDVTESFLWGYDRAFPIANVTNASSGIWLYAGFEDNGDSSVGDAKTGLRSKLNGFESTLSGLTPDTYTLSYWKKQSGIWSLQTTKVNVADTTYTVSLTGQVDDIRFYPASANMTSYTYHPQFGVTSISDVNNKATYYEYDNFGRLQTVRDDDRNIVKTYKYNYKIR